MTRRWNARSLLLVLVLAAATGLTRGQQAGTTVAETYREAYDFGYRDGSESGANDRRLGKPFDLANKKDFQQAERGLDPQRHDREVFLVAYRRGFEDGYEKGYGLESKRENPPPAPVNPVQPRPIETKTAASPPTAVSAAPIAIGKIPLGTEVEIELLDELSTRYNERGDPFRGRVPQDMVVNGRVLIPRGSMVSGSISYVKRAGRIRGRAQMNLKFEELRLPDGRVSYLDATLVGVEPRGGQKLDNGEGGVVGESSRGSDAKRVAGSSGIGALIGLVVVGKGGAGAGAAAGAVAGLANVLVTRGRDARLEAGTQLTIKLNQEVNLSPSKP